MTYHIDFQPVGRRGECPAGLSLLECARRLGVDLVNICGGAGTCGRCIVQVLEGTLSPPTPGEGKFLSPEALAEGYRLACRATPLSHCKVRVPPESLTTPQRTQVEGEETSIEPDPPVRSYLVTLAPPSIEDLRPDAERLLDALAEQHGVAATQVELAVLRDISPCLRDSHWQVRAVVREGRNVVALLPPEARPLGLAVDVGTTKVAAYLMDMESGRTLAARGIMNPQIAYGEDVVARMTYASQDPDQARRLQSLVIDALNHTAAEMATEVGVQPSDIVETVIVGNTAIHHLILKLPVTQLARAPYVPAVDAALDLKACELGLHIAPGGTVHLLPNIAGYVGADHVSMLLATGVTQAEGVVLAIDIGTNTEVCLVNHGRLTSLSCASGPAFEGAHIKHGMRAASGAIERVRFVDGRLEYQTIGGTPPVGLCGSGILDVLAQLYQAGIVNRGGRMQLDHPQARETDGEREFVLVEGGRRPAITFTQKDVRELQLAKGAMRTGIQVLLEVNGLVAEDIDQVVIAGAFGTYIDVASAIAIDMLPRLPLERFRQVGNAAGMGAKLALISRSKRAEAQAIAARVDYVELASAPNFMKAFAQSMYLE
ncbi:MAG: DUF4445 domain-containing protein [Anaerolineae bacterium]|nr:DUF4445 domain-containing protein [Anaerolineae bacterium]